MCCKQLAADNTCATHTHSRVCSCVCTDCSRSATLLQPQILSSPKTARKMQISTQHATRPATGSRQQAACSIRQTGCVGDIHSSFDLYRLATCNMRRCICARWLSSHLPPFLLRPQRVSTDCNQDWLFACARLCEGGWGRSGRADGGECCQSDLRHGKLFRCVSFMCATFQGFHFLFAVTLPASGDATATHFPLTHCRFPPSRRFAAVSQFAICELLISTHSLISVSCSRWPTNRLQGRSCTR